MLLRTGTAFSDASDVLNCCRFVMDELESLRVPPKPVTMNGTGVILNYIKRIHAARQV